MWKLNLHFQNGIFWFFHEILAYCHVELGIDAVDDYFFVSIELICLTRGC